MAVEFEDEDDILDPEEGTGDTEEFEDDGGFGFDDEDEDFDDDDEDDEGGGGGRKTVIIIGVVAIVVVLLMATLFFKSRNKEPKIDENQIELEGEEQKLDENGEPIFDPFAEANKKKGNKKDGEDTTQTDGEDGEEVELDEDGNPIDPEADMQKQREKELNAAIGIGVQDLSNSGASIPRGTKNTAEVTSNSPVQDFQSTDIPMFYEIDNIRYVSDHVSYTKYRATTAPGVELYWLDATYQGKRAIIPTSLGVFQNLAPTGVVGVDVEVTTLVPEERGEEPQQVITGFYINLDGEE